MCTTPTMTYLPTAQLGRLGGYVRVWTIVPLNTAHVPPFGAAVLPPPEDPPNGNTRNNIKKP